MKINDIIFKSSRQNQPARVFKQLLVIFLFSICIISTAFAAKPVTVIVSLRPPYTPFLNEYGSLGADQLQVSIIVNDSRMINYPAKLQMLIERVGSGVVMRTGDYASIAPIMLTGNVTEFFNGFDLSEHFLYENLVFVGMDGSQYIRTGRIPNDRYRIGFRIVDSRRPEVVLSNTSYSQPGWFLLNDPPQINIPINQSVVRVNEVQNVKFNWFPRHLGSLNKSFSSLFQLEVFAIRVPGMNPNQLASSMSPNFTDVTSLTSYFLTSDKYVLEPGVEYAFRVKAMSGSGDELTLFQNQGYSDVHSFTYGTVCHAPENNIAEPLGRDKVLIKWDNAPSHTSFEVRFRRAGHSEDKWLQRESVTENVEIGNILSSGVSYEYQIKGICLNVASDYSPLSTFTLPEPVETDFDCGAEDSVIAVTNRVPKQSLRAGDKVHYGKFPIKLTEVSGSNGIFTGKGRMRVPFLAYASVNMQFNGIKVNELNEVYEGEVVSIYNPDSKFLINDVTDYFVAGDQVGNIVSGEAEAAITLDYVVGDASNLEVTVSGNSVTVRSSQGSSSTHSITTSTDSITISDSEGNLYVVDKGGGVSHVGRSVGNDINGKGGSGNASNYNQLSNKARIEFYNDESDLWAFDKYNSVYSSSKKISREYELIGQYYVPWKLVPSGKSGKVKAKIVSGDLNPAKVKFVTGSGTEYISNRIGNNFEITIIGSAHGDGQELYAIYSDTDSTTVSVGKLKIASYNMLQRKLAIVPVGENNSGIENPESKLNAIYLRYGIEWSVRMEPAFTDMSWSGEDGKLDAGKSGFFTAYTSEMKSLNRSFRSQRSVHEDEAYLFVFDTEAVNEDEDSGVLLGDMPIGYQFGYLFSNSLSSVTAKTIAHELGHGIFQLNHTFESSYGIAKSSTNNLMDYTEGVELVKQQWDAIYDPQILVTKFLQDDEEGEYDDSHYFEKLLQQIRCAYINGDNSIPLPEDYKNKAMDGKVFNFTYGLPVQEGVINGDKISLASLTTGNKDVISNIRTPKFINNSQIEFDGIVLKFTTPTWSLNDGITPWEHLTNYLFPENEGIIKAEFKEVLNQLLGKAEFTDNDIKSLKRIANCGARYFSVDDKHEIISKIARNTYLLTEYYEDLILDLLESYNGDLITYSNGLLELLNNDHTLLKLLFNRTDDEKGSVFWKGNEDNFTRFLEVLFALWNGSKYADTSNYTYLDVGDTYPTSNVLTPRFISYDGNSWFPDVSYSNPSFYSGKFIINSRTSFGEHARIEYEYFQPIYLGFVKDDNKIGLTKVPVPAIYFAGIVKKDNLEKRLDQVGLTIDVALTLTAIGNVAKLRHLTKLKQLGRVILASVEITSGFADIMIRYTDLCEGNDDFCEAFQEYNTYLQLGLLSSGLIRAKFSRARNNAKDQYIKHRETLVKRYGETDTKIKELDGHFGLSSSPTPNSLVNKSDDLVRKSGGGVKSGDDVLLASLKTKFTGKTKVLNWLDEFTDNAILKKLDDLPTSSISKMEDDILALKAHFNSNPSSVDAWAKLKDAPNAIRKNIDLLEDITNWPKSWKITKSGDGTVVANGSRKQLGTIYSNKIVAPARKVSGESGNALLNRVPLVKNMKYDVDGFIYETDELGRVLRTDADLDDVVRIRLGNQQIKAVDVKDGVRGTDQGGHIVGSRFFGPGEQINLYPQSANLNQGAWKQMENTWADAMVAGKSVKIKVEAVFEGASKRPEAFEVSHWIDGAKTERTFINQ